MKKLIIFVFIVLSIPCVYANEDAQYKKLCIEQKLCESKYVTVDFKGNYKFIDFDSVAKYFEKKIKFKGNKNKLHIFGYSESKKWGRGDYLNDRLKYKTTEILNIGIHIESHNIENKLMLICFIHLTYQTTSGDYITERLPNDLYLFFDNTELMRHTTEENIKKFISAQVIETIFN